MISFEWIMIFPVDEEGANIDLNKDWDFQTLQYPLPHGLSKFAVYEDVIWIFGRWITEYASERSIDPML